jgi:hypothetical protein
MFITILPWELVLYKVEDRFVMITTSSEENLYRGNNRWIPEGFGSYGLIEEMQNEIQNYSEKHNVNDKLAERNLAIQFIRDDPYHFLIRGFYKIRDLWSVDSDIFTYILSGIYPPQSENFALLLFLFVLISPPFLMFFAILGFICPDNPLRHKELFILFVFSSMVMVYVTMGEESRFHVPLLVILLPSISHGILVSRQFLRNSIHPYLITVFFLVVTFYAYSYLTGIDNKYHFISMSMPSSYYSNLIRRFDNLMTTSTYVSDRVLLRFITDSPHEIIVTAIGEDYTFYGLERRYTENCVN